MPPMESPSASARGRCHPKAFECKVFHLRILPDGFLGAGPGCCAVHLAQLLIRAGDIELNPGPPLRCPICCKGFRRTDSCVWCHHGGWTQTRCTQLASDGDWNEDFLCGKCSYCVEAVKPQDQPKNRRRKKPNAISVLQLNASVLEFKPSFRRIAEWIELESGLQNNLVDTHTTWLSPWQETSGIQIIAKPPNMPKRTEAPELRKQRALEATDKYQTDVTVWTDGSVQENQRNVGAGIFLIDILQNTSHDMKQPAGAICISTRAELVAIETALSNLPESYKNLVLYTDSRAALQTLQKGPTRQTTSVGTRIWENLVEIRNHSRTVCLNWVPGHADLDGNEHADTGPRSIGDGTRSPPRFRLLQDCCSLFHHHSVELKREPPA